MTVPYVPLHCRSYYSLLKGCFSPETVCEYAAAEGYPAVGLTDINNFYGLIRFLQAAERYNLKPVAGVVISPGGEALFTAYCKNLKGFSRLNEVITKLLFSQTSPKEDAGLEGSAFDPVAYLVERGWEGLWIVSDKPHVLERFAVRSRQGLHAALYYGRPFNRLAQWARREHFPLIALNDAVFFSEKDRRLHSLLRAIDENTTMDALDAGEKLEEVHRFLSAPMMERFFSAVPEALRQTVRFSEESEIRTVQRDPYVFPRFGGLSEDESFAKLRHLCYRGIKRRYGKLRSDIQDRIRYELSIIRRKGFASYFLVVHDIVGQCPRTCGRGSSASSIVSYLLGITHIDPLSHNLFFERFLNMGRKDPPDIDVDFPWDEREKALNYVFQTYAGRSGMVADHVTFGPRSCFREPAKAMGMAEEEITRIVALAQAGRKDAVPDYLLRAASLLRGMPRHIGTHPGGVIITPDPITEYTHLQISGTGFPVIAWEKEAAEDAGLVKIDLLGNRSLGVLRDTINLVNGTHAEELSEGPIEWETFQPLHDRRTRELIEQGRTLGVFYVESPATRQLLRKMRSGSFEHLVIASSIIRPAANRYITEFVERLHGKTYEPVHPLIDNTLRETFGIMVYQEDVARVAIKTAGFSAAEADGLRKVLSKKDREIRLKGYRERFFCGGKRKGVGEKALNTLWEMILSFDGYSFCKAHSASYALVSYRLAWMKRYFPLEFLVSVINNGGGFYRGQVYLNEVRRMGVTILGPDVNESEWKHTVENGSMRLGLSLLRDISNGFIEKVLRERGGGGRYLDFLDFLRRIEPGFTDIRVLIRSGALDGIAGGYTRAQLFWGYFHMDRGPALFSTPPAPAFIGDYSEKRKVYDELKTLGVLFTRHPLSLFESGIRSLIASNGLPRCIDSRDIPREAGNRVCIAGVLVTGKEVKTRNNRFMSFVSFEDPFSVFETVLFPDCYKKQLLLLNSGAVFLVVGVVKEEIGSFTLEVRDLIPLLSTPWPSESK